MMKLTKNMLLILLTLICSQAFSDILPIDNFVWTDQAKLDLYLNQRINPTDPPATPVRAVAEFEPAQAVLIRYPLGIPTSFVALLSQESPVICIVEDSWDQNQAQSAFDAAGVNNDNLSYIVADTDSYWTRDFTSWFVVNGNNQMSVLDFEYNRPRPYDNLFPQAFAQEYDYPYYAMNIEQTGGNFMTDGYGIAAASHIAYTENGNNENLVNTTMEQYMGITNYMVIQDPNNTYIDHIDCWGKFLDVDKVLIREVPSSHAQYDEIEDVANYFATTNCSWGYPYQVIRVYTPNNQPYTNSLILNDRVFVPQTGSSWDDEALEVYENAMPGYRIFGVTNNTYYPWESTDALHCRTHEIPDREMLSIQHYPRFGNVDEELVSIEATILALSGQDIYADSTLVYYRVSGNQDWLSTNLQAGDNNLWTAEIGPFETNQVIQYYLHSADQAGKSEDYPFIGAADPFEFVYVAESNQVHPPLIEFEPVLSVQTNQLPLELTCTVTDPEDNISSVTLWYYVEDDSTSVLFNNIDEDTYSLDWNINDNEVNDSISYRIEAQDTDNLTSTTPLYSLNIIVSNDNHEVGQAYGFTSLYPNPFNDSLSIKFRSKSHNQSVKIYNLKGQLVKELSSSAKAGSNANVKWDGQDFNGKRVSSGVYYMVLESENLRDVRKVLLLK